MHHPTDMIPHTMVFVTPGMEHWLESDGVVAGVFLLVDLKYSIFYLL